MAIIHLRLAMNPKPTPFGRGSETLDCCRAATIGSRFFPELRIAKCQRAAGFFDAAVAEALAGKFTFTEAQVGEAAEVETVGASPGVLTVGVLGAVERVAGVLESFARIAGREVGFGEELIKLIEPLNIDGVYHALSVAVLGSYVGNFVRDRSAG